MFSRRTPKATCGFPVTGTRGPARALPVAGRLSVVHTLRRTRWPGKRYRSGTGRPSFSCFPDVSATVTQLSLIFSGDSLDMILSNGRGFSSHLHRSGLVGPQVSFFFFFFLNSLPSPICGKSVLASAIILGPSLGGFVIPSMAC